MIKVFKNFNKPSDYSGEFYDYNVGAFGFAIEHCYNPGKPYETTTKATCLSISIRDPIPVVRNNFARTFNLGVGDDFYSKPYAFVEWGNK